MDDIYSFICNIPKAELHLHIEGTFEPEQMFEFASRNYITIEYKSIEELRSAYKFNNLQEFLDIYYTGAYVLRNEKDFYEMTMAYLKKAAEQNIVHTEIFFDPQTHLHNGVPFEVFFNGIYKAAVDAEKMYSIHTGIIMCFLRHLSEESAFNTLELALPYKDKILGVGLDSSEVGNPPEKFSRVFEKARQLGFLTVAHAGEEGPAAYIHEALDILKIDRIDHGNNSKDSEVLMDEIARKRIALTMCPLSNLKLAVVKDLKDHPLRKFLDKNIAVTINSDDPAYFGGYLNENLLAVQQALDLTHEDIIMLVKNSFEASFISNEQKEKYLQMVDNFVAENVNN
ncbi:MAG TPA: adenosine deaminase [Bacteroidales bacterium]|nr:adenosine deaminase [Bacteroidales bacterium]